MTPLMTINGSKITEETAELPEWAKQFKLKIL
jgi:hypothetical protein